MTMLDKTGLLVKAAETGTLDPPDVIAMRRDHYADGAVAEAEAAFLFDLDRRIRVAPPEWTDFFLEALTDHLVEQVEPVGYVDAAKADWLFARIMDDGKVRSETELELLVRICEKAREVPPRFAATALAEVRRAVLEGDGVTRLGRLVPGRITGPEVALLRRVLFAAGGAAGIAVSREEAEVLFEIDDAAGDADAPAEWPDLFAKAVGNYLMGAVLHAAPAREEVLRRQRWLDEPTAGVGGFLGRMIGALGDVGGIVAAAAAPTGEKAQRRRNKRALEAIEAAAAVTPAEVEWVVDRMGRNGRLSLAEAALVDFLRSGDAPLPPAVGALVEKLPRAA